MFLINVPQAVGAVVLALISTPPLNRKDTARSELLVGRCSVPAAMVGLVYGLAQRQPEGWTSWATLLPLFRRRGVRGLFVVAERRVALPLIAKMFGHLNFTASTISRLQEGQDLLDDTVPEAPPRQLQGHGERRGEGTENDPDVWGVPGQWREDGGQTSA
jgi:hypothetical protein